jgi:cytidylate kinase
MSGSASRLIIAIDGPAGAGKSTVASRVAARYGLLNLETGAMYRAFALQAVEAGADLDNEEALLRLTGVERIRLEPSPAGNRVYLNEREVTQRIREGDIAAAASRVSVHPGVRKWMVAQQRRLGAAGGVVMEGRDIGSAVFPQADLKIFLDAEAGVRGKRRQQQTGRLGEEAEETVLHEIRERDRRDKTRAESPLAPADGAIILDSTDLTLDEVVNRIDALIQERIQERMLEQSQKQTGEPTAQRTVGRSLTP